MVHTVKSLTKLTKKNTDELISLLEQAGITNKTANSEISTSELKALTQSINDKRKNPNKSVTKSENLQQTNVNDQNQDSDHSNVVNVVDDRTKNKIVEPAPQKQQQELPESRPPIKKYHVREAKKTKFSTQPTSQKAAVRKPKLKKKDRSRLSQKLKEEQEQQAFHKPAKKIVLDIKVPETIRVSDLALKMKIKAGEVLKVMMGIGVTATLNDSIDQDSAMLIVEECGHNAIAYKESTIEDSLIRKKVNIGVKRAPVITIMGHVNHGKTSLLDYVRKSKVVSSEAGDITQHIGAYHINSNGSNMTFIDTPGHAAFSKMRERGANITDIIVLVVAIDDGVMPQTIQSIEYAKKAKVSIIVAVNKIDKQSDGIEKIKQILSTYGVLAEDLGGDTIICPISATTGEGIDNLLESITLTAEILELKAETDITADGTVLEARIDKGRGKIVDVLIQSGTLKNGDIVVAGTEYGKVKQIISDTGSILKKAGPSTPVKVLGFSGIPDAGDEVIVVENEKKARELTNFRKINWREKELQKKQVESVDAFFTKMEEKNLSIISVMIKTDVKGSKQAIVDSIKTLSTDKIKIKVIASGVGAISNTDVALAATAKAIILGFNVRADNLAKKEAVNLGVTIKYYSVIYNLIDDIKAMMNNVIIPELSENIIGLADVREVFKSPKFGDIAGSIVTEGMIRRDMPIRVLRKSVVVFEGKLESLKRFKNDVLEVKSGRECGIGVLGYDVEVGDQIEVFEKVNAK